MDRCLRPGVMWCWQRMICMIHMMIWLDLYCIACMISHSDHIWPYIDLPTAIGSWLLNMPSQSCDVIFLMRLTLYHDVLSLLWMCTCSCSVRILRTGCTELEQQAYLGNNNPSKNVSSLPDLGASELPSGVCWTYEFVRQTSRFRYLGLIWSQSWIFGK